MAKPSIRVFGKRALAAGGIVNLKYKHNGIHVINKTGASIAADKLVAVVGFDTTTELPKVVLADSNAASSHKNVYVALVAIADGAEGYVFEGGASALTLDTSGATTVGDPVYLSTTAGGFAHTAPAQNDAIVLPVGWVTTKSSTVGEIQWHIGKPEKLGYNEKQVAVTAATATLTAVAATHSFRTVTLGAVAGFTTTLPASSGGGDRYRFVVATALTSASYVIQVANATDVMAGGVIINDTGDTAAATADFFPTAATSDTFTMTQSIGSGKVGDWFEVEDIKSGTWAVHGVLQGVTDPATPFTAAV